MIFNENKNSLQELNRNPPFFLFRRVNIYITLTNTRLNINYYRTLYGTMGMGWNQETVCKT